MSWYTRRHRGVCAVLVYTTQHEDPTKLSANQSNADRVQISLFTKNEDIF